MASLKSTSQRKTKTKPEARSPNKQNIVLQVENAFVVACFNFLQNGRKLFLNAGEMQLALRHLNDGREGLQTHAWSRVDRLNLSLCSLVWPCRRHCLASDRRRVAARITSISYGISVQGSAFLLLSNDSHKKVAEAKACHLGVSRAHACAGPAKC